jgi:hypothetical protein
MWVNPALQRHKEEAALIGHMLLAYGEIELLTALCLARALNSQDSAFRMMYRIMGETNRIQGADAIMRPAYVAAQLVAEYDRAMASVSECTTIRNRYAHCQWADHAAEKGSGLFFVNLRDSAMGQEPLDYFWLHVDVPLLTEQTDHFDYTAELLQYVEAELAARTGRSRGHGFQVPPERPRPPKNNDAMKHIPRWLDSDQQQRHLEHAQGRIPGDAQPKPKWTAPRETNRQRRDRLIAQAVLKRAATGKPKDDK